jgi:hypothetical protein
MYLINLVGLAVLCRYVDAFFGASFCLVVLFKIQIRSCLNTEEGQVK